MEKPSTADAFRESGIIMRLGNETGTAFGAVDNRDPAPEPGEINGGGQPRGTAAYDDAIHGPRHDEKSFRGSAMPSRCSEAANSGSQRHSIRRGTSGGLTCTTPMAFAALRSGRLGEGKRACLAEVPKSAEPMLQ